MGRVAGREITMGFAQPVMELKLDEFCRRAADRPELQSRVLFQQLVSVMTGIAVLYARAARKQYRERGVPGERGVLAVKTQHAFASELVPRDLLLKEIGRCAGVNSKTSDDILTALEQTLRASFQGAKAESAALSGIGTIHPVDLDQSRYNLVFDDLITRPLR
jgi:hypothetical protein